MKSMIYVVVVPMIMIVALSIWLVVPTIKHTGEYTHLLTMTDAMVVLGEFVHEQQNERGASAVFLGSGGRKFRAEMAEQRRATNHARESVSEHLPKHLDWLLSNHATEHLGEDFETILENLAKLDSHRDAVDGLRIDASAGAAFYTQTNAEILMAIEEISRVSPDSDITAEIISEAYPSEPGLTTCWVCGCRRQDVRLMFCHAQPLEIRPPDVPRRLRGALSR